ncbi:MAG TPA: hypothetical protein VE996_09980 [Terriglobales bacterium]|nr:hypothetical protein [Terriglobales bacterium]
MRHFSEEDWLDYVRQVGSAERNAAMTNHLVTGCVACSGEAGFWERLRGVAARMVETPPPVQAPALSEARWLPKRRERRLRLDLVFDSYSQPLVAIGTRAAGPAWSHPRQMMFFSGDLQLDLRLEPVIGVAVPGRVALVGQVQRRSKPESPPAGASVRVMRGRRLVGEATTNNLGEFQLEFNAASGLTLLFGGEQGFEVALPD